MGALAACGGTAPRSLEERYQRLDWAKVTAGQAEAECRAEINRPGGIPNMYLCMRSKGWQER